MEIVDGQDGNIYLYVGEKNSGGGREIAGQGTFCSARSGLFHHSRRAVREHQRRGHRGRREGSRPYRAVRCHETLT